MKSGIYKITNLDNGKFYIGSARNFTERWEIHKKELRCKCHHSPKLQHSWDLHGESKFSFSILEEVDIEKLFEREQYYLDTLKPYERDIGYNVSDKVSGGNNIKYHPDHDAFIEKMKTITRGEKNGMYGKNHTNEAIQKQKAKAVGRYTLEWFIERYGEVEGNKKYLSRNEMLKNRKINYSYGNPRKGKKFNSMSDETKQKLIDTKMRMREIKPLVLADISSGNFTMKTICEKYNIGMTAVKYYKRKLRKENELCNG